MARSLWTGSISFGLVSIPVKLFPAVSQKEVHFHMLHEKDGSRVRQKLFCEKEDKEISRDEVVKGYELGRGKYVEVSPDELKQFIPEATNLIEMTDFVELHEIDPVYYEHSYHVVPDKGGAKAYKLLHDAMKRKDRVGIAHVVMRQKQYLCALRVMEKGLLLTTMQYADEILPMESIAGGKATEREVKLAEQLIASLEGPFQPEKYEDTYRKQVLALIHKKAKGRVLEPVEREEEETHTSHSDLASALMASLKASNDDKPRPNRGKRPPAARATRKHAAPRRKRSR